MRIDFLTPQTVTKWGYAGLLRFRSPGQGVRRNFPVEEVRAARALDAHRRLAGVDPSPCRPGGSDSAAYRKLQVAVADAARNNPPGTVVEIPGPVSWIRTVVVVPEP